MKTLRIEKTDRTPEIVFDPENSLFKIVGKSYPENAYEFYHPVLEWLRLYSKTPNKSTILEINLQYQNSSTSKQIVKLLLLLESMCLENDVLIKWYWFDEETKYAGKRYLALLSLPIELVRTYDEF